MSEPTNDTLVPSNGFGRLLSEFRGGASLAELSESLQQLVSAIEVTGHGGEITYKLKLAPKGNAIVVTDDIKLKLPEQDRDVAIFFPTEDHTLSRSNPAQREFALREVQRPAQEIKEIAAAVNH